LPTNNDDDDDDDEVVVEGRFCSKYSKRDSGDTVVVVAASMDVVLVGTAAEENQQGLLLGLRKTCLDTQVDFVLVHRKAAIHVVVVVRESIAVVVDDIDVNIVVLAITKRKESNRAVVEMTLFLLLVSIQCDERGKI
jgi:hypothetical protein